MTIKGEGVGVGLGNFLEHVFFFLTFSGFLFVYLFVFFFSFGCFLEHERAGR